MVPVDPDTPVGATEIAALAGVSIDTVKKWRERHPDFPAPTWPSVGGRPAWRWATVQAWLSSTRRMPLTNAELAALALEHHDAELEQLCHRVPELGELYATYLRLTSEADDAEDFDPRQPDGEDYVPAHRRPGPVRDAYLAYKRLLREIAGQSGSQA